MDVSITGFSSVSHEIIYQLLTYTDSAQGSFEFAVLGAFSGLGAWRWDTPLGRLGSALFWLMKDSFEETEYRL